MSQAKTGQDGEINNADTAEELLHLQCEYYRRMNALLTDTSTKNWGERLELMSQGAFLPGNGFADVAMLAGLLNQSERAVETQLSTTDHEQLGFGRRVFYAMATWFLAARRPDKSPPAKKK